MLSKLFRIGCMFALTAFLTACFRVSNVAEQLSSTMLDYGDPATLAEAMPPYLIMIDTLLASEPDNAELHLQAARLYGAYANLLEDTNRTKWLSERAWNYAQRGMCLRQANLCNVSKLTLPDYQRELNSMQDTKWLPYLYGLGTAWTGWIQQHSADWSAIADLPKVQLTLNQVLELDPVYDQGNAQLYMAVLLSLRPAALGGQPELAKQHFLNAIAASNEQNLMAKVLYAKYYARLLFDRELHDQLLSEVLQAEPEVVGLTLSNILAQQRAQELLNTADEYF